MGIRVLFIIGKERGRVICTVNRESGKQKGRGDSKREDIFGDRFGVRPYSFRVDRVVYRTLVGGWVCVCVFCSVRTDRQCSVRGCGAEQR